MLLGLLLHALQGIDQQQCPFGPSRPGDHVLEKLLVPRRIDDDVVPTLPTEERPRRIDGDSLLLFFKKGIEQERILEFFPLLPADGLDLFKFAIRQRSRVGIETPQQGGLPVVHVPDNDDVQIFRWFCISRCHVHVPECSNGQASEATGGVPSGAHGATNKEHQVCACRQVGEAAGSPLRIVSSRERSWMLVSAFCAYMYPSFRSNSIPRPSSCARPDRSATVVCRNSSIMSSTDFAVDLIGVVQGAQPRLR